MKFSIIHCLFYWRYANRVRPHNAPCSITPVLIIFFSSIAFIENYRQLPSAAVVEQYTNTGNMRSILLIILILALYGGK